MAETIGVVASAISIAALFNNCVQTFEYIQLGRHFARDFERYQLKLDIARTRLSRWGEAVKINENPRFAATEPVDIELRQVLMILEQINHVFGALEKTSRRYELSSKKDELVLLDTENLQPAARGVHDRLKSIARQRQKGTSLRKKMAWALYDGKNFDKLLNEMTELVGDLETHFNVDTLSRQLAVFEIQDVRDMQSLQVLRDVASDADPIMSEAIEKRIGEIVGSNFAKEVHAEDRAMVKLGNEWRDGDVARNMAFEDRTVNRVERVNAKGRSTVMIGNSYGGESIFEF